MSHIEDPSTESTYDEEITRVGAQIHQLIELQADLLRRRNRHCSPIYKLPLEILAAIFSLSCIYERTSWERFGEPNPEARILSSVSSYWRQVVLQTPRAWSVVTLAVEGHKPEVGAARLQRHFEHIGNLDISVELSLDRYDGTTYTLQDYEPIANILFAPQNAQNVTTLRVENIPVGWLAKLSQLPRLHTLVLADLQSDRLANPLTIDFYTQSLRRLFLSSPDDQALWGLVSLLSSVQELVAINIAPSTLLMFLRQCPNLIKVVHNHWDQSGLNDSSLLTTPLTLGRLETLSLPVGGFLNPTSVQNLFLPVLQHLNLKFDYSGSATPVITFCHRFSGTLRSLELHHRSYGWEANDIRRLFLHKMEHLEMLKLTDWRLSELVMAIQVLTPSDEEFCRNEVKSLPRLRSLVVEGNFWRPEIDDDSDSDSEAAEVSELPPHHPNILADDLIDLFLALLEKRRAGELTPFCLELPVLWSRKQELRWLEELLDKFSDAIEGQRIKVLQDRRFSEEL